MQVSSNIPVVVPALGDEVAKEVLQWIGAFRLLSKGDHYFLQHARLRFLGNGLLSELLIRQLAYGATLLL